MKIRILTVGTRGDVQPFVALGGRLVQCGHEVTICTAVNFKEFVESNGVSFSPVRVDFLELTQSEKGKKMMGGSPLEIFKNMKTLIFPMMERMLEDLWEASKDAEVLIYSPKAFGGYDIAEKLKIPVFLAHPIPIIAPTTLFTNPALPFSINNGFLNKISYKANSLIMASFFNIINKWRKETLGLKNKRTLFTNDLVIDGKLIPIIYGCSPTVIPFDNNWGSNVSMEGFWFLEDKEWEPPKELVRFLERGISPIAIGFSSMPLNNPLSVKRMFVEALERTGQRGIFISGWSGIKETEKNDNIFVIDSIPHSWLFPKTRGIIHHGGAGTTAAALQAGKPMLICPFSGDQPFWATQMKKIGVATFPLKENDMSVETFIDRIKELLNNKRLRDTAESIAIKINSEKGIEKTIKFIHEKIVMSNK
ncbi:glycosyltransferase [Serpentinicella alkaliphila]|uniref:Sterol 3beta-glucosyltransferase n=1 Tax=Serpentinicella alkaliphila TaxID=1734049 RepID=A0A4R2TTI9_9FIRM|nr:glycosyltransferase [Serpentinicella alkaliphila]QUH25278.1 glycosyltransferase family 1 protein [Serpentinicella alkaliphila]TCQ07091.1 sterol 3beta-glucosyltransferase [Serpentinicella alkaliphila]